jgi:ArsR family transcriptional regulator
MVDPSFEGVERMAIALQARKEPAGCCVPVVRGEDRERADREAPTFAALGDPVRVRMLRMLARSPALCVCEIQRVFDLGQPTISHHLRILREAGLVDCERRGVWAYYFLEREAVKKLAQSLLEVL